ncbi:TetR/AcrR family transcriptional regulator [Novosphingobium sp.]|uniref:TetR/AcrR family transcriptional regulator n=1 Tax=Novosphingobium sp. TaxID=1874826 RepID=UPI0026265356|nr:TetR/AcrR family transcriptional regulator [Novosphingobium sp.]
MHKLAENVYAADMTEKPKKKRAAAQLKGEITAYKRRRILEEASHFFFANGYEATTLDSVAEQLNVTKPFIYSYYKNKGELLYEICQTGIQLSLTALEEALAVEGTATEQLKIVVERVARIIIENQRYVTVYLREEKSLTPDDARRIRDLRHTFDTKLAALLEKGKRSGEFDVAAPSRTAIWVSGLLSWIALWYHEGGRWSATEVVMDAITMVQKMVQPAGGPNA